MHRTEFHALYERYSRDVYRFALYLSGDAALAEDVAADTFARAWTSSNGIRTETVKAYLFSIARNLVREAQRRPDRAEKLREDLPDPAAEPALRADGRIELRAVLTALQRLTESDRAAILMRAQDGLSHAEIARVLGISVAAVRVKIHRARLELNRLKIRQERQP